MGRTLIGRAYRALKQLELESWMTCGAAHSLERLLDLRARAEHCLGYGAHRRQSDTYVVLKACAKKVFALGLRNSA